MELLPRGMAFVDFPNVTSGARPLGIFRLNFPGLAKVLTEGTRPVGVMAYVADRGSRQELFREINRSGLKVEPVSPGKSVDGRLIFDMIVGAQRNIYDICILASGDRDYLPVMLEAKKLEKQVWVASFANCVAPSLVQAADKFIKLDDHIKEISYNVKGFNATCADCGKPCTLPFEPTQGRPVYCRECYEKRQTT